MTLNDDADEEIPFDGEFATGYGLVMYQYFHMKETLTEIELTVIEMQNDDLPAKCKAGTVAALQKLRELFQ